MSYLIKEILILIAAFAYAWAPFKPVAFADEPEARAIMEQVENAPRPADQQLQMTMILVNSQEQQLTRILEVKKQGDEKSYLEFLEPADVEKTAFLNISHPDRDDEMYLYLPALHRVRRIASSSKHRNFMGSDFTYDDMGDRDIDDYTYTLEDKSVQLSGYGTYLITGIAKDPAETGYSKLRFWIRQDIYMPVQIEYYDLRGDLKKIQTNSEFKQIQEYWLSTHIEMRDVQENHKTILEMRDIQVDIGLPEVTWTQRNLRR
ncbi:MAG TPA: outer membrane lipoprotein-sorting protein [bacterium]|nr:outer membrane lipoprotein-sorting protein [bacterium]